MGNSRFFKSAFNGGELSQELFGRVDIAKFTNGLELSENFICTPHGPALNRSGTQYVNTTKFPTKKSRLIPFVFNNEQSLAIEMGDSYFRFHTQGATVVSVAPTSTLSNPDFAANLTGWTPGHSGASALDPVYSATVGFDGNLGVARFQGNGSGGLSILSRTITGLSVGQSYTAQIALSPVAGSPPPASFTVVGVSSYTVPGNSGIFYYTFTAASTLVNLQFIATYYTAASNQKIDLAYVYFGTTGSLGVPVECAHPYTESELFDVHYVQSGDVVTLVHPNHPPAELRRIDAYTWAYTTITFGSTMIPPDGVTMTTRGGTSLTKSYSYLVTAIAADGFDESAPSLVATIGAPKTITAMTNANPGVFTSAAHGFSNDDAVLVTGISGLNSIIYFIDSAATNTFQLADGSGQLVDTTLLSFVSGSIYAAGAQQDLSVHGHSVTVSWNSVPGAARYNVYKYSADSGIWGYIGQSTGTHFKDDNIIADVTKQLGQTDVDLTTLGNYPSAVCYYEQRRCFANSTNFPRSVWMTRNGTESNLTYSIPSQASDALRFKIAAQKASAIRHLVPLTDLIALTASNEWRIFSSNNDALTATSITIKNQSSNGCSNVQPVSVNNMLLFPAAQGGHIREMTYNWQVNGFQASDICLLAPHLFDGLTIKDMAFSRSPYPILWAVSSNGNLLGMTYVPEQQIAAWHRHTTYSGADKFESVAVVTESRPEYNNASFDITYVIVNRGGSRYVECMHVRLQNTETISSSWFLDCALGYSGAPISTVSGLSHLEGRTVGVFADGKVQGNKVVTGGAITLDVAASSIVVGLPILARMKTLPITYQDQAAGQGRPKNVARIWAKVYRTVGLKMGPDESHLTNVPITYTGGVPNLTSDEIQLMITPTWSQSGQVYIEQSNPLPATIVGLTTEFAAGG